jgi:hypothetical protein
VTWFKDTNANLTDHYGTVIPSLAFFHIPISSAYHFQNKPSVNPSKEPGQNGEKVTWQGGMYDKNIHDVEFMKALVETDGLLATFSGHDHDNDWLD